MSDVAADPAPIRPPRRPRRRARALTVLGVAAAILLILLAALYLNRRAATREVLIGWLERQGVDAEMDVQRVELDGLVASIRIGDPADPDVTVQRVEVDYAIGAPWSKAGLGITPSRIRLVRPVVRASVRGGELSLGSLDPLVERFTGRPPRPDSRGPLVLIERARVRLDTDYGPTNILGDARVDDGKLMRLNARMPATAFKSGDVDARGLGATVDLTTTGDRVALRAGVMAERAMLPGLEGEGLDLTLTGDLPYPDLKTRRGDGGARLEAGLSATRLTASGTHARDATIQLNFDGQVAGWIEAFRIDGTTNADVRVGRIDGPVLSATTLRLRRTEARAVLVRDAEAFSWRSEGGVALTAARASGAGLDGVGVALTSKGLVAGGRGAAFEAEGPVAVSADRAAWGEMSLSGARASVALDLISDNGLWISAPGSLTAARGAWPLFGPPAGDDLPELVEMKRALSAFAVDIPAFSLTTGASGARVILERPATLRPANGGVLMVRPRDEPLFAVARGGAGGGALSLTASRGKGLPEAEVAIPSWRLTPDGFSAVLDGHAALDFGLARGITVRTRGELASANGRLTYVADGCSPVTVERLELGENDVVDLAADLCPVARPLATIADGAWRSESAVRGLSAAAPFMALDFAGGEGGVVAAGGPGGLALEARIDRAAVTDATTPLRFYPLVAAGAARLADENWNGGFDLSRQGTVLGRLTLAHDGRSGVGGVAIDAPSIVFAEDGLQPTDLSPMAGLIGSPASGSVGFQGRIDWRADAEGASGGRLTIPGLDFVSPAGPVKGLRGTIDFINLAPLTAVPGQRLTADRLESVTPLTDIQLTFGLDKAAVTIQGGDLVLAGGHIRIEPLTVPLDPSQGFSGVIVLEQVQLGRIIAGAGFGDRVNLDAVVSGRLPFTSDPVRGIRVTGGTLAAIQPGRLSIEREALTGLEAGGGGEAVPPNTVQDLAYQAMENLSFDILSAEVNSLDEGRIGVLFHIKGRHDPPVRQELRVSIAELISRDFLNRELPLPSGTGIDLTLDTTLNLNQLIGDLLELNRSRNGESAANSEP